MFSLFAGRLVQTVESERCNLQVAIQTRLHQRAVLWPQGHDKLPRGAVGNFVRAPTQKSYRSLITSTTVLLGTALTWWLT